MTIKLPIPDNRRFYALHEPIVHHKSSDIKMKHFFDLEDKGSKRKIVCAYTSFARQYRRYIHDKVLPLVGYGGTTEGRPRLILDSEITLSSNSLLEHVGENRKHCKLIDIILKSVNNKLEECGLLGIVNYPYFNY